ncbi:MAG: sugar ABC transporter permease [Bacilli bacterium]|nr:sugar ABC transporter permease [Bacilli bacterium]
MAKQRAITPRQKDGFFTRLGKRIRAYFAPLGQALVHGDWATKLSFLLTGFGYFFHSQDQEVVEHTVQTGKDGYPDVVQVKKQQHVRQWLRGVFFLFIEALAVLALIFWGIPNFGKLGLDHLTPTGTLENGGCEINFETGDLICTPGDNAFLIVLQSVLTIVILIAFFFLHLSVIKGVYASEVAVKEGKHIKSAKEDLHDLIDDHFYVTVLALPILGIVAFTVIPTIIMILIAFTNYGGKDASGSSVTIDFFNWVGFTNWANLFSIGSSSSFLAVFGQQLLWTLIWAFFATFTCFFGGLLLALLLNSKRTRFTKVWRTGFVITIAVPQFVSLMLIRYFLADNGIVNNLLSQWGLTTAAKNAGLISGNFFPFLSDPTWTKVTVILVNCWVGFPYLMLMISGILMNIPADLYESARIDGASRGKMFRSITMPYIFQVCTPYLISSFVSNINNFNVIYLLTYDGVTNNQDYINVSAKESDLLITWLYNMIAGGAKHEYYMASIVGILMFTISTIFTLVTFTQSTKGNRERRMQ